jgi:hypothetical protein
VANNIQKTLINILGSAQKTVSDTIKNVSSSLSNLGWLLAVAAVAGTVILLKK